MEIKGNGYITIFIPTPDTMTKFVVVAIWMSRNLHLRGDSWEIMQEYYIKTSSHTCFGYLLESLQWGDSNKYPKHTALWWNKNKKKAVDATTAQCTFRGNVLASLLKKKSTENNLFIYLFIYLFSFLFLELTNFQKNLDVQKNKHEITNKVDLLGENGETSLPSLCNRFK